MIKENICTFLGFCPISKVWTDYAVVGFFLLGSCLGLVLGMCVMSVKHLFA